MARLGQTGFFLESAKELFCGLTDRAISRPKERNVSLPKSGKRVAGFGHQLIKALIPPPPEGPDSLEAQPGPRIMHGPTHLRFRR